MENERDYPLGREEGSADTSSLEGREVPQATRLSKLALVVAAAVMSVTLLVVALMVTTRPEPNSQRPVSVQPARQSAGPEFMKESWVPPGTLAGAHTVHARELYTDSIDTRRNIQSIRGGEEVASGAYVVERYVPPTAYRSHTNTSAAAQPSPERQALERALHAALKPQGLRINSAGRSAGPEPANQYVGPGTGALSADYLRQYLASAQKISGASEGRAEYGNAAGKTGDLSPAIPERSDYIATGIQYPRSPYEIREGTLVEAFLVTGIHSDLPGEVVAQVARNVFDSHTQQVLLIPRGTRLIGAYDNQVAVDQSRLLVAWTRMVFPDGRSVNLPGLNAKDGAGRAGLQGSVNRHYWRAFGDALMLSVVGTGLAVSSSRGSHYRGGYGYPSPGDVAASSVATELSRVATEMLRRDLQRRPTIKIREGTAFNVFMNGDLALQPYEPYDQFLLSPQRGYETVARPQRAGYTVEP